MNKVYHGFSKSSGVYKITNKDNGLVYFGQAVQLATRAMQHEKALTKNKHSNYHLQASWNKYGSDVFEFEVIAVYPDRTERDAAEQALIDEHYGPGCYNISKSATAPMLGRNHSQDVKDAISTFMKTVVRGPKTAEQCAAQSALMKGRPAWNKGKKASKEACAAQSAAHKGLKRSAESCAKQSAAMTGKKRESFTPEHRAALSAAHAKRRAAKALLASTVLPLDSDLS